MLKGASLLLFQAGFLQGVGEKSLQRLAALADSADSLSGLIALDQRLRGRLEAELEEAESKALYEIELAEKLGVVIRHIGSDDYPDQLKETSAAPNFIYLKGNLELAESNNIAVIGTRKPSSITKEVTRRFSSYIAGEGFCVLSGLAEGCDKFAHEAALEAQGATLAVLPAGLNSYLTTTKKTLAKQIIENNGLLVSQFKLEFSANKGSFVMRDKTQAGLSSLVCLMESSLSGGSLHACRSAIEYGRWLGFLDLKLQGLNTANELLARGIEGQKEGLLMCSASDLERVVAIESKNDYEKIVRIARDFVSKL